MPPAIQAARDAAFAVLMARQPHTAEDDSHTATRQKNRGRAEIFMNIGHEDETRAI